jgi:hypothetical protein
MCQTAFALVPACDEHGVPSRLSGRLDGKPQEMRIKLSIVVSDLLGRAGFASCMLWPKVRPTRSNWRFWETIG